MRSGIRKNRPRVLRLGACLAAFWLLSYLAAAPAAAQPLPRHEITGRVSGLIVPHHVVVRTSGRGNHTTTTHADGVYILRGLRPGTYTVRPVDRRYRFSPTFHTVAITNHDVHEVDFVAHPLPPRRR